MSSETEDPNGTNHGIPPESASILEPNTNGGDSKSETLADNPPRPPPVTAEPLRSTRLSEPPGSAEGDDKSGGSKPAGDHEVPDWLPESGWRVESRVRTTGASAGTRDKYYFHLETGRRFRSKAEVMSFLGTGQKKRTSSSAVDSSAENGSHSKKSRKAVTKLSAVVNNFNFDDVPAKVTWEMTDIYTGSWRPLHDGGNRVPEGARQQWAETFTYLTMHDCGKAT